MTVHVEEAGTAITATSLQLRGQALVFARLAWAILVAQAVVLFAVAFPAQYRQLSHPPADVSAQLAHAGLSVHLYAAYLTAAGGIVALVCCCVAALILRHRPHDRIGLLASLFLVLLGLSSPQWMQFVARSYPALALPANLATFLFATILVAFFFLFPDGRFVPGWSCVPVLVGATGFTIVFFRTGASVVENPPDWMGLMMLGGAAAGVGAQIYRFARVSDREQRQQTKWVALGATGAILTGIVFAFVGPRIPSIGAADTGYGLTGVTANALASLMIPVTLGLAILRRRLWDIDVVINRTLVYGALTVGLVGLYLLVVGGLGMLFRSRVDLAASLLATALVAVLFAPLRDRLQTAVNRLMYGDRDDPYRVLTRLGERVGAALAPDAVLPVIAETVASALKAPYAAITLGQTGAPAPAARARSDDAVLRFPLEYQGERVGELLVGPRGPGEEFSPADRRLLGDLARQIGPAVHAVRLAADLQRSRERLVTAREEERRRLRRDLHDGLGPQLAALTLKIETVRNRFANDRDLDAALVDLTARTQAALSDIRRLVYGLRPPTLDELGLVSAIREAAAQYSQQGDERLHVTVDAPESLLPLPAAVEAAAYRIAQEALANAVRHSAGRTCRLSVSLDRARDVLCLQISDDGRGLPDHCRAGVGLVSMRERAEELGGRCSVASRPSGGTLVEVELPCPPGRQQESADSDG